MKYDNFTKHCVDCSELKHQIELMGNTIEFEVKRANVEAKRANEAIADRDRIKMQLDRLLKTLIK